MNIYGLLIGTAVVIVLVFVEKKFQNKIQTIDYIIAGILTLLFARVAFIIHHLDTLAEEPLYFFYIHEGGVSILGAIIGIIISTILIGKKRDIKIWELLDTVFLALPFAQAVGRLGNYFNQELYGYPTNLPWGIYIDKANRIKEYIDFEKFHPIFAYESILNIINGLILLTIYRKYNVGRGIIASFFLLNYGIIRLFVNRFRIEKGYILDVETADFFASILILVGSIMLIHMLVSKDIKIKIAKTISSIFNPFLLTAIPFFVIAFQKNLFKVEPLYITLILILGLVGPIVQFKIFRKLGVINDWDISDRTKRPLFTTIAGFLFLGLFLISLLSVSTNIKVLTLSLTIVTFVFAAVSTIWKISGHLTYLAFTICALYLLTQNSVFIYILFPALIIIGYSRVILKQHSIKQTIAGSILGIIVMAWIWFIATYPLPI